MSTLRRPQVSRDTSHVEPDGVHRPDLIRVDTPANRYDPARWVEFRHYHWSDGNGVRITTSTGDEIILQPSELLHFAAEYVRMRREGEIRQAVTNDLLR